MAEARMSDESLDGSQAKSQLAEKDIELVSLLDGEEDDESIEQDILDAKEARKEFEQGRCIPHEEVKRRYRHDMASRVDRQGT